MAEGEKVVRRLLESQFQVLSALLTPEWLDRYRSLLNGRSATVYVAPKSIVETIVGFRLHQGIMAMGAIPQTPPLSAVLQQATRPYLLAAVDGLTNADNLGVLVRNCAAFGVQALLVGETSSSPYLRRAVRNSMGAVFSIPIIHVNNLAGTLSHLRQEGVQIIAADPHASKNISDRPSGEASCCIIFGSEAEGISRQILEVCDFALAIPMERGVDSLNVASASAVFLYELRRKIL